ncbi:hypothetical protein PPACK8108_LOCUS20635 [Phakopsora pachyrhizi]|uniref:Uncharacterized protein n=1 Tax=Phakopsora pachyrhizi TaxID=170000 RepID=A0AAV0BIR7_PHAPC|nr:hypothetical protein PPACK8108_LOCUS20635 [Phakopsora pachyrhizi]
MDRDCVLKDGIEYWVRELDGGGVTEERKSNKAEDNLEHCIGLALFERAMYGEYKIMINRLLENACEFNFSGLERIFTGF